MTEALEFTDRASFVAYRARWRLRYAQASKDVRDVKRTMRGAVSTRRAGGTDAELRTIDYAMSIHQCEREIARVRANALMVELGKAKERRDELLAEKTPQTA